MTHPFLPGLTHFSMCCILALALAGCGGGIKSGRETGKVVGEVILNGKPLTEGTVCFIDGADGDMALGTVGSEGKFTLKYNGQTKIPAGNYLVTVSSNAKQVSPQELMKNAAQMKTAFANLVPAKYQDAKSTDLKVEVKPGENDLTLELDGKVK